MLHRCASDALNVVYRLCGAGKPSDDLLPQQSTANALHDPRVPQCCLQVSCSHDGDGGGDWWFNAESLTFKIIAMITFDHTILGSKIYLRLS